LESDFHKPKADSVRQMSLKVGPLVDGAVLPWAEADPQWRAWALSEVSVRVGRIADDDASDPLIVGAVEAAKARWPQAERVVPLIALQEAGATWRANARNAAQAEVDVVYSTKMGLIIG